MKRIVPVVVLVALAGFLVAAGGEDTPPHGVRYLLTVIQQSVPEDATGHPLSLSELGSPAGAILPTAPGLKTEGFVAAVPHSKKTLAAIRARGEAKVLWRGEVETTIGRSASWISRTRVPVPTVSLRGNARTVSVTYEEIGAKFEAEPIRGSERTRLKIEFSNLMKVHTQIGTIAHQHSSQGGVDLPDGYTAVYSFLDRIPAAVLTKMPVELRSPPNIPGDLVTQYFVLVTRMDVAASPAAAKRAENE